jgi:hypothetical protein
MALSSRQIPIFVSGGIDTKTDPRVLPQGSLVEVENMYYQRTGELRLRNGFAAKTTNGIAPTSLDHLFSLPGGTLECFPATNSLNGVSRLKIKLGSASSVANGWAGAEFPGGTPLLPYPAAVASVSGVYAASNSAVSGDLVDGDTCATSGLAMAIWRDLNNASTFIYGLLIDQATGVTLAGTFDQSKA